MGIKDKLLKTAIRATKQGREITKAGKKLEEAKKRQAAINKLFEPKIAEIKKKAEGFSEQKRKLEAATKNINKRDAEINALKDKELQQSHNLTLEKLKTLSDAVGVGVYLTLINHVNKRYPTPSDIRKLYAKWLLGQTGEPERWMKNPVPTAVPKKFRDGYAKAFKTDLRTMFDKYYDLRDDLFAHEYDFAEFVNNLPQEEYAKTFTNFGDEYMQSMKDFAESQNAVNQQRDELLLFLYDAKKLRTIRKRVNKTLQNAESDFQGYADFFQNQKDDLAQRFFNGGITKDAYEKSLAKINYRKQILIDPYSQPVATAQLPSPIPDATQAQHGWLRNTYNKQPAWLRTAEKWAIPAAGAWGVSKLFGDDQPQVINNFTELDEGSFLDY